MKIFLDSANMGDIKWALESGVVSGVTTNPSLVAKEPKTGFEAFVTERVKLCLDSGKHVSIEFPTLDPDVILTDARRLSQQVTHYLGQFSIYDIAWQYYRDMRQQVVVKVPVGPEYMRLIGQIRAMGLGVNVTACFTAQQALLAEQAGATYVSLFYCRMCDAGLVPDRHIETFAKHTAKSARLICGSIRTAGDALKCWDVYPDCIPTTSRQNIEELLSHEKTTESIMKFQKEIDEWLK